MLLMQLTDRVSLAVKQYPRIPDDPAPGDPAPDAPAPDVGVAGGGVSTFSLPLPRNLAKYFSLIAARGGLKAALFFMMETRVPRTLGPCAGRTGCPPSRTSARNWPAHMARVGRRLGFKREKFLNSFGFSRF